MSMTHVADWIETRWDESISFALPLEMGAGAVHPELLLALEDGECPDVDELIGFRCSTL